VIKENTIYCKLMGQMGNQMFQIAAVIAHSLRHKKQYVFPQRSGKRDQFPMMFPHLSTLHEYPLPINGFYREEKFGRYFEIPQSANYLVGYFQSSKYFEDYLVKVIEAFQLPKYEQRLQDTISMHIRRGDSLANERLNQPSLKYFHDAIEHFPDSYKVLIFTDDIVWAKEKFKGDRFTISDKKDPKSALTEMTSCMHHVITNSTFSWWGAYLDLNTHSRYGGTVICPSKHTWFIDKYKDQLTAEDIVEDNWIQIDI